MIFIHTLYVFAFLSGCSSSDVQDEAQVEDSDRNNPNNQQNQETVKSQKDFTSKDINLQKSKFNNPEEINTKDRSEGEIKRKIKGEIKQDTKKEIDQKKTNDKKIEKKTEKESSIEMGDMELFANLDIHFSGVAPLFQNYFYNENAQESYLAFLHRGASVDIRNLPVYVRWDDVGHSMGRGEICVYSPKPLPQEHIQSYSKALYAYRTYVGSYFDVRLMSFSMCIESSKCRFEVLDRSDISGVTSCVTILSDSESGSLRPLNSKAKGEKVCTSSFDKEQRSKTPISYDSIEEQFSEMWSQIEGCFLE